MQACLLVQNMLQEHLQSCEDQLIRRARHRVRCEAQAHIEQGQRSNKWTVCLTSAGVIAYLNKRISPLGARPSARVPPHPHLPCYVHGWEPARHRSRGSTVDSAPRSCAGFLAMSARVCPAPYPCWECCSARHCSAARPRAYMHVRASRAGVRLFRALQALLPGAAPGPAAVPLPLSDAGQAATAGGPTAAADPGVANPDPGADDPGGGAPSAGAAAGPEPAPDPDPGNSRRPPRRTARGRAPRGAPEGAL